jgi:hypothetical protein
MNKKSFFSVKTLPFVFAFFCTSLIRRLRLETRPESLSEKIFIYTSSEEVTAQYPFRRWKEK